MVHEHWEVVAKQKSWLDMPVKLERCEPTIDSIATGGIGKNKLRKREPHCFLQEEIAKLWKYEGWRIERKAACFQARHLKSI